MYKIFKSVIGGFGAQQLGYVTNPKVRVRAGVSAESAFIEASASLQHWLNWA